MTRHVSSQSKVVVTDVKSTTTCRAHLTIHVCFQNYMFIVLKAFVKCEPPSVRREYQRRKACISERHPHLEQTSTTPFPNSSHIASPSHIYNTTRTSHGRPSAAHGPTTQPNPRGITSDQPRSVATPPKQQSLPIE